MSLPFRHHRPGSSASGPRHGSDQDPERGSAAVYHLNSHQQHYYYEYHHGRGEHVLVRGQDEAAAAALAKPQYSLRCLMCHCVDGLVLLFVFAFLGFSLYLAYYVLNNYGG